MDEIIIVFASYKPNTAPTNRLLSILRGFDEQGVKAEMVFVYPSANADRLVCSFENIRITYLWDKYSCRNKWYKYIRSFYDIWQYARGLANSSNLLLMSSSEYLPLLVRFKKINVYHERTEHPFAVKLKPAFLQNAYLKACKKTKGMFVISTALRDYYQSIGVKHVSVVNMTVDATRFAELKKEHRSCKYIAYCGTASNNKDGVDELIKSFAIAHKIHPDLKLYIVGKTPQRDDRAGNLQLIDDLGIQESVVFTGIVSAEQMPQLLKNADILALDRPDSLQAKCGFPTKLGEYLLTENPVVVTRVGDIPLFLEDGKSALMAEQRNPEAFASKIMWVLEHSSEAQQIGKAGAKVALRYFNYKTESRKIIDTILNEE